MGDAFTEFDDLVRNVVDGTATEEERRRMVALMRESPQLQKRYCDQMRVHSMLLCRGGGRSGLRAVRTGRFAEAAASAAGLPAETSKCALPAPAPLLEGGLTPAKQDPFARLVAPLKWWKTAAAAAVLLGGGALWRGVPLISDFRSSPSALRPPASVCPVCVVRQWEASGLELPAALPGALRLGNGLAVVRLESGVELTLLGPVSLEVRDVMQVRLESGRLVAWVPTRASGFTVHAPGLTAWDIGTVFSVEAEPDGSSLFVFKGSVQVLDESGDGIDICEAGEGVRATGDKPPFKVTAEGEAAERLFKPVRGLAAVAAPQKALDAARQIGELWMAKNVPEDGAQVREKAEWQAALRNAPKKIPFTKTAWVRPSVPAQQEEISMKTTSAAAALTAVAVMLGAGTTGAASVPIQIETSPGFSRHWHTVFTNEVGLMWDWYPGATCAELSINGMNEAFTTNFVGVTSNYLWRAFTTSSPSVEDVYDLRLTFYNGSDAVVGVLTSRLAVVKAAFGKSAVIPSMTARGWATVRDNAVIPYDDEWAAATADAVNGRLVITKAGGAVQANALADAAGYFGWKLKHGDWGYGIFNLALTFPGYEGEWDATVNYIPNGTLIGVR